MSERYYLPHSDTKCIDQNRCTAWRGLRDMMRQYWQEALVRQIITDTGSDLDVPTRYRQIVSDDPASFLSGRCINIHHSFLPGFKCAKPYHQAFYRDVKITDANAHYVTMALDEGAFIHQHAEAITLFNTLQDPADTLRDTVCKIRDI